MTVPTDTPDAKPHLSYSDLMGLSLSFNGRIDTLWLRVLYTHAAIVGVMVFFATAEDPFVVPRLLVFCFYTLNTAITMAAFHESYAGLRAVLDDLRGFPSAPANSHVQDWVQQRSYHRHARRRILALGIVWAVLAYLLVVPVLF